MPRPQILVRRLTPELTPDFVGLWNAARAEAGAALDAATRSVSEDRLLSALDRDDLRVYLAMLDQRPIGFMVLTQSPLFSLTDSPCLCIDQIFVVQDFRRQGAARALLSTAATYADVLGADQISSSVPAQARETNRFFARLGFSSLVVRRVTSTASLHRKLIGHDPRLPVDQALVQRRRSLRARAIRAATAAH